MTQNKLVGSMTNKELALYLIQNHEKGTIQASRHKRLAIEEFQRRGILDTEVRMATKNVDIRQKIRENKLTQAKVAAYLTDQSGRQGTEGKPLSSGGLRQRLDRDLTDEEREEIFEAIEQAIADNFGIV